MNLTELKQEENCAACYTGVLPYWSDEDGNVVRGTVQDVSGTFDYVKVYVLDCSQDFEETPTAEQLNAKAVSYIENNNIGVPKINLTLNFVMLQGLLNRVDLCDTVRVIFEKLGVEATAKCIRVRWNVLLDRYEEAEFGDAKTNITDSIIQANNAAAENAKSLRETATVLQNAIDDAVQKISGNLGGYVILHDANDDGYPDELLIMDTPDITTATNVWRWNQNGLMHANSYTGTYANAAITMDGQIVADAITTGILRGIEIISTDGTNTIDLVSGHITTTGDYNAKTITSGYQYGVYDSSNTKMGALSITYINVDGVMTPIGAMLEMNNRNGAWMSRLLTNTLTMRNSAADNTALQLSGVGDGGSLTVYDSAGTICGLFRAMQNYGRLYLYTSGKLGVAIESSQGGSINLYDDTGLVRMSRIARDIVGGHIYLSDINAKDRIYLGHLSLTGLMTDTPSLAFMDDDGNGNTVVKSWYSLNRAYIYDDTSGEQGYVVHGHSSLHGITVDYTATGRIDFYVDTNYVGYATLTSSDKKTKKGVKAIPQKYKDAVASVDLKSFHFNFKGEVLSGANDLLRFGAIAQDVISALEAQGIDPTESELVDKVGEGKEERYVINYIPFLTARLAADEDRIQKLEEQNKALEERLARLEARWETTE